ncbi:hypothetical protein [Pseudalkalibacillus berkeleyi]|uniref:Multidrug transporter n=1 Tax=Pseudalkalibacillus berkeleyi TaxID=1069813 RepID=A0ABS9GXB8_9BACL|nr:hypothetical protein [Pseudalkalibacillus berkeleyi]MCF6136118.1 hypothetical protein [Pseudalkalibacillus berkeleyi]
MTKNKGEDPKNSSMVNDEKELREHSKVMENVSSNEEVKKSGKTPDPVQHEQEADDKDNG